MEGVAIPVQEVLAASEDFCDVLVFLFGVDDDDLEIGVGESASKEFDFGGVAFSGADHPHPGHGVAAPIVAVDQYGCLVLGIGAVDYAVVFLRVLCGEGEAGCCAAGRH